MPTHIIEMLRPPKLVAIAKDRYLTPTVEYSDRANLWNSPSPKYGQDIRYGKGREAPEKHSVGTTEADLKSKMSELLDIFASGDKTGMAKRLFNAFLTKKAKVGYFEDPSLNKLASQHENIIHFCHAALSAPNSPLKSPGKTRIHQALKAANWDINKINVPTDLGVPAFNIGSKAFQTGDFNNGLGVMINGIQYAYVLAENFHYDAKKKAYGIALKFVFYDVFGLDDDDLNEFGASSDSMFSSSAAIGITAWWQLQHQHNYAPLITRIIVRKTFIVSTK